MTAAVTLLDCGPGTSVQDAGRPGWIAQGLSRGGAMDRLALAEGAALLNQPINSALELAGFGGRFQFSTGTRFALTGAPMRARIDGQDMVWNASHRAEAGQVLEIGGALDGVYGYLTFGGGLDLTEVLGAQSAHFVAGLGPRLAAGQTLPLRRDTGDTINMMLDAAPRFGGGTLRVVPSLQTDLYSAAEQARFAQTSFTRSARGNRMGMQVVPEGAGFALENGTSILSEIISPGDIQIPGDGAPYVLMAECQTTGGYPRIGTVIPADLPRAAQSGPGARLRFAFVDRAAALQAEQQFRQTLASLPRAVKPRLRDPHDIADLLSYNLISGTTAGEDI